MDSCLTCCWGGSAYLLLACHGIKFVPMVEFQRIQYGRDHLVKTPSLEILVMNDEAFLYVVACDFDFELIHPVFI